MVAFLDSLPRNTIGLDLGAGNGNHLPLATYPPDRKGKGRAITTLDATETGCHAVVDEQDEEEEDLRVLAAGSSSDETLKRTSRARESNDTPGRFSIALDYSHSLLSIAKGQLKSGGEGVRAELGYGGWRRGVFVSSPMTPAPPASSL